MQWEQLRAVGWLRWRLTRNQWSHDGGLEALSDGLVIVSSLLMAIAAFTGGVVAGWFLKDANPDVIMGVWLALTAAFLVFWVMGLLIDLQRSATIDLPRLMHLPVALGQVFVVNYLASHLTVSLTVTVSAILGLAVGMAAARGSEMWLMVPLALSMVLMVTAWTYWLRGWLATLIDTPGRRGLIITLLSLAFVALSQGPNIYFNLFRAADRHAGLSAEARAAADESRERDIDAGVRIAERVVPVLWVSGGARALAEGRVLPSLAGTFGALLLALLGLTGAYRSTLRSYRGETGGRAPTKTRPDPERPHTRGALCTRRFSVVDRRAPAIPEPAAAVALVTLQTMMRASEVLLHWGMSVVVAVVVGASLVLRREAPWSGSASPFVATGAVLVAMFMSVPFFSNQFGFDRDGFRAFVLAPIERRHTLLGKNLASMLPAGGLALILVAGTSVWLHLPALAVLATLLQLVACLLAMAMVGNVASVETPFRLSPGTVSPTRLPAGARLVAALLQLGMPLVLSPAFLPVVVGYLWNEAGGPPAAAVNAALSGLLALAMGWAYIRSLAPLARRLWQSEEAILRAVTTTID
jgi:ABC-2 type transport system permease protein